MFKCEFWQCENDVSIEGVYCDVCCNAICEDLAEEWEAIAEKKAQAMLETLEIQYEDVPVQLMLDIFGKAPWDSV